jgi:hypothetical protein
MPLRIALLAGLVPFWLASPQPRPARRITLFAVALNDVSNQAISPDLPARIKRLTGALGERLTTACGYRVTATEAIADTVDNGPTYLYAHPELAVSRAGPAAEWVIVPRLNRATPWVTDLQANVVRVRDTSVVSNRIVEVKGIELGPELAAKLIERGAAWMADQLSQAIEHAAGSVGPELRRCPA